MRSIFVSSAVAALFGTASAWWDNGHMITARIAYDELSENHPDVLAKANNLLSFLSTKYEDQHAFVESATFPDKFKYHGLKHLTARNNPNVQGPWHFVDNSYFEDDYFTQVPENDQNVTTAIRELTEKLRTPTEDQDGSYQLRCLIHYLGDIHQPLHATTMFSQKFPKGDRGGNSFKLQRKDGISELHALWDSVVTEYANDWAEPLSSDSWTAVGEASTKIRNINPRGRLFLTSKDPNHWADESFEISKAFVYKNIEEHTWPSASYIETGKKIAEQRLAYGGYRLADLLVELWGQEEEQKFLW